MGRGTHRASISHLLNLLPGGGLAVDVTRGQPLPGPILSLSTHSPLHLPQWRRSLSSPSHAPRCADPSRHVRRPSQVKCRPWRNDVSCTCCCLSLGSLWVFGLSVSVLALNLNFYFLGAVSRSCTWLEWCWCWVLRVTVTRHMWYC